MDCGGQKKASNARFYLRFYEKSTSLIALDSQLIFHGKSPKDKRIRCCIDAEKCGLDWLTRAHSLKGRITYTLALAENSYSKHYTICFEWELSIQQWLLLWHNLSSYLLSTVTSCNLKKWLWFLSSGRCLFIQSLGACHAVLHGDWTAPVWESKKIRCRCLYFWTASIAIHPIKEDAFED